MGEMPLEKRKLALDIIEQVVAKCVETGTDDVAMPLMDAIVVMEAVKTAASAHLSKTTTDCGCAGELHFGCRAVVTEVADGVDDYTIDGFGEWLTSAYSFRGDGSFTRFNMEVAYAEGMRRAALAHPRPAVPYDIEAAVNEFIDEGLEGSSGTVYPSKKTQWFLINFVNGLPTLYAAPESGGG